jgi:hypothetical protein
MSQIAQPQQRKNRVTLVLLLLVFVLPIFIATLFSLHPEWLPNKKNYGELVTPMRDVPDFVLQDIHGKPFTRQQLDKKWSIVYLGVSPCEQACVHTLYNIRQSRLAQAANVDKVQYIYLAQATLPDAGIIAEHPDMLVVTGTPAEQSKLLAVLQETNPQQSLPKAAVYLIDTDHRVMMKYPEDFAPKGLIKDLELIFKVR